MIITMEYDNLAQMAILYLILISNLLLVTLHKLAHLSC
nr:MAG TPA: hypothetical protein [Caudoviricetes sp.]